MTAPGKPPYHHGDLRSALVDAATELARHGGPSAIVLREAARRVGVSQTAAYRHFASLPDLVAAVAAVATRGIADAMLVEMAKITFPDGSPEAALAHLRATGRGYVQYALSEPGLYATAFGDGHDKSAPTDGEPGPYDLLQRSLGGLVDVGLLDPASCEYAAVTAWAGVHGLSMLLLGPLSDLPAEGLGEFIDSCLSLIALGLVKR